MAKKVVRKGPSYYFSSDKHSSITIIYLLVKMLRKEKQIIETSLCFVFEMFVLLTQSKLIIFIDMIDQMS